MDARARRSRDRLFAAVLRLAAARPVAELTTTEVAAEAGVHRSTVYEHAASPGDLLRAALVAELDLLREGLRDPGADAVAAVNRGVLRHVRDHRAIYARGLAPDAGPGSLHGMLAEHFAESGRMLLRDGRIVVPVQVSDLSADEVADAAARFVAHGTVGAIQAWVGGPGEPDVDTFEVLYTGLLPDWWVPARPRDRQFPPTAEGST